MEVRAMNGHASVVTGGAQGIGKRVAERLFRAGASVAILDVDEEAGAQTLEELIVTSDKGGIENPGRLRFFPCDVAVEAQVRGALEGAADAFGRLDSLVNNAGIFLSKTVTACTLEDWNRVLAVNLTGAFLCSKYAALHLKARRGTIVNMSSTRALMSERDTEAYAASKGGILALTHALAVSLGPEIRVNSVSPGWIEVSELKKKSDRKAARLTEADHRQHPAGRVGEADDIASMVLFLLSADSAFITGQNFVVDGGMTRKMIYVE